MHEKTKFIEVNDEQKFRIEEIRHKFSDIFNAIDNLCIPSRETSLAITKLEEAQFWAIKGITREVNKDER